MDINIFEMPFLWICAGYLWGTLMTSYFYEKWSEKVIVRMINSVAKLKVEGKI